MRAHNKAGWGLFSDVWSFSVLITGVGEQEEIPAVFSLSQNYPNPFNPSTTIRYGLPEKADVRLELFNVLGQRVVLLVDQSQEPGYHSIELNASGMGSGVYLYRLQANQFVQVKRLSLLR